MKSHVKIEERLRKRKTVGLYKLVGGSKNGELSSERVGDFLARNILEQEIRERLSALKSEY